MFYTSSYSVYCGKRHFDKLNDLTTIGCVGVAFSFRILYRSGLVCEDHQSYRVSSKKYNRERKWKREKRERASERERLERVDLVTAI